MSSVEETAAIPSIVFENKQPHWDFSVTTAYPVELTQKSKNIPVYVYLTPYSADDLKVILQKAVSGYKREKRDVEIVREDRSVYAPLCDEHFVKLGNATGTPEAQKAWLDKYPELKPSIVEHTFGGLRIDQPETLDDEPGTMLDIGSELSGSVKVYQEIYDPATDKVVRVNMAHNHSHPTESQYREYKNSKRNRFLRKTNLWTITESHSAMEKLYDTVIQSIDGALVAGNACTNATKANWIGSVPLWHKLWVVDQIFGEIIEKNV